MTKKDLAFKIVYRDELRRALIDLARNPAASVSVSSGAGSKSYSTQNRAQLQSDLAQVEREINAYRESLINGGAVCVNYARWC